MKRKLKKKTKIIIIVAFMYFIGFPLIDMWRRQLLYIIDYGIMGKPQTPQTPQTQETPQIPQNESEDTSNTYDFWNEDTHTDTYEDYPEPEDSGDSYENTNSGTHTVDGYYRSDGTYVDSYERSNPDDNPYNNLNP